LHHPIDRPPELTTSHVVLLEGSSTALSHLEKERVSQAARRAFGTDATWQKFTPG
jgi:hypothetical protein